MYITFTAPKVKTIEVQNWGKAGDKIEVEFKNEAGEILKYTIKVSYSKNRLTMN